MTETGLLVRVVQALAAAEGVNTAAIDYNLSDDINPEVLRQLEEMDDGEWSFTFRISDHQVTITDELRVFVDGKSYTTDVKNT